jgi:hypothetical protein
MVQQSLAALAVLVALAFAIMALSACASSKQEAATPPSAVVALPPAGAATPEFHGAAIGADALRSRLQAEG